MNIVSQKANFRQSVVLYSLRNSVFYAIRRFGVSGATIYRWRKRYNGTPQSLVERSRRPHSHPNQHTPEELKLISDMRKRNPELGLVVFWVKLMQRGYSRSIPTLWRILKKLSLQPVKPPNPKYVAKPYEPMLYLGQRVQMTSRSFLNLVLFPMQTGYKNVITNMPPLTSILVFVSLWRLKNKALILPCNS